MYPSRPVTFNGGLNVIITGDFNSKEHELSVLLDSNGKSWSAELRTDWISGDSDGDDYCTFVAKWTLSTEKVKRLIDVVTVDDAVAICKE